MRLYKPGMYYYNSHERTGIVESVGPEHDQSGSNPTSRGSRGAALAVGRPKVGLGIYIYSCHAGELFGFVPVARDEQAFSC